jgi:hypothetical protein
VGARNRFSSFKSGCWSVDSVVGVCVVTRKKRKRIFGAKSQRAHCNGSAYALTSSSSAAGYTSVPPGSNRTPGVSFAGSIWLCPMMCDTVTPSANR